MTTSSEVSFKVCVEKVALKCLQRAIASWHGRRQFVEHVMDDAAGDTCSDTNGLFLFGKGVHG